MPQNHHHEDDARGRLIAAGRQLFAMHGIEGVRTRALVQAAGVNQSAIPYYFGGKEGLYTAVIEAIADELADGYASLGLLPVDADAHVSGDKEASAEALYAMMHGLTLSMLSPGRPAERTLLIVREQIQPTSSFDLLFQRFIDPMNRMLRRLVAGIQSLHADEPIVIVQSQALVGQALSFAVARQAFLRHTERSGIGAGEAEQIADIVATMSVAAVRPGGR